MLKRSLKKMNLPSPALCVLFLLLSGCLSLRGDEATPEFRYRCELPEGLEKEILLHHKDNQTERRDAHAIYRRYHSIGWHQMMSHYAKTGKTKFKGILAQEWGIMTMARDIGTSEARTLILKAELVHGEEKLRAALKRFYKERKKAESEQDGARQPATALGSTSEDSEKPKQESEGRSQ